MAESLRSMLPPVYRPVFSDFFDRAKPDETRATCADCAMCDKGEPSPVPMEYFLSDAKCCTYFPQLPNYLVGAILADDSPDMALGKERIRERIKSRIGVTPHWLTRPHKMTLIMQSYSNAFGRAKSLLCPYYDTSNPSNSCTIWRHREAVCMTYYCKYAGGQRGFDFWSALKAYLGYAQRQLARHAQVAVAEGVLEPVLQKNQLSVEDIEDLPPKASDYMRWWGPWAVREEEFYVKCHDWLRSSRREVFQRSVDQTNEGQLLVQALLAAHTKLQDKILPKSLVRNARMKEDHVGDKVVVTTYHRYDSFALDKDLYDVIGLFRANETLEANLARLAKDGAELAPELIEYLFAAGVLVEPAAVKVVDAKPDGTDESVTS
jgi:hypothetical protein